MAFRISLGRRRKKADVDAAALEGGAERDP